MQTGRIVTRGTCRNSDTPDTRCCDNWLFRHHTQCLDVGVGSRNKHTAYSGRLGPFKSGQVGVYGAALPEVAGAVGFVGNGKVHYWVFTLSDRRSDWSVRLVGPTTGAYLEGGPRGPRPPPPIAHAQEIFTLFK